MLRLRSSIYSLTLRNTCFSFQEIPYNRCCRISKPEVVCTIAMSMLLSHRIYTLALAPWTRGLSTWQRLSTAKGPIVLFNRRPALEAQSDYVIEQIRGMKVRSSVKKLCDGCKVHFSLLFCGLQLVLPCEYRRSASCHLIIPPLTTAHLRQMAYANHVCVARVSVGKATSTLSAQRMGSINKGRENENKKTSAN